MSLLLGANIPATLVRRAVETPNKTAQLRKRQGVWVAFTWKELEQQVFEVATCLRKAGIGAGDRVGIVSQTRYEWAVVDWAILSLGAVSVPVYPSLTADDIHYILRDARAKFAFIEGLVQKDKIEVVRERLPNLQGLVSFDPIPATANILELSSWSSSLASTELTADSLGAWRREIQNLSAESLATLVYTSGTEGLPKGVQLTHQNFLAVMQSLASMIEVNDRDLTLVHLPVAHIMGRVEQMLSLGVGWTNAYSQGHGSLIDNLKDVQPTVFFGVPRIYEKIFQAVVRGVGVRRRSVRDRALTWALSIGKAPAVDASAARGWRSFFRASRQELLDRLVFSKVREQFGARLRFAISGGAPLGASTAEFFHACGVPLLEGYGLTETTGPLALSTPEAFRCGTVGKVIPGIEIKFLSDGEICVRGPSVFGGYEGRGPRAADEWFATGDIGALEAGGFLRIVDRKKDLIITSGGKNIAPLKLEELFTQIPLVSNMLVAGDDRNYLTALFTLNVDEARRFCDRRHIAFHGLDSLIKDRIFLRSFKSQIDRMNEKLPAYEQIKRFRLLTRDFSIEAGELTPSLKVKRSFCTRKYAALIEEMYR
ncbi:MAG: long-chain fatty acid--CoA ligase [Bdellovibrionales bacterium]|nr:long-chain fatty acid--CoA ligase [Bdellovibrionales bacterium]